MTLAFLGLGVMEILILLLIGGGMIAAFGVSRRGDSSQGWNLPRAGKVKLNCPKCGAETPANQSRCQSCGEELVG